jgi:WD40 repeat protein
MRWVSASHDQTLRIWDAETGDVLLPPFRGHNDRILCVAVSPDGQRIASGGYDRTIRIWDAGTGALLSCLHGHEERVWSVSFSADGRLLASSSEDQMVRLWNMEHITKYCALRGHQTYVCELIFSSDGQVAASWSRDGTTCLWNVDTGECTRTLDGTNGIRSTGPLLPPSAYRAESQGLEIVVHDLATWSAPGAASRRVVVDCRHPVRGHLGCHCRRIRRHFQLGFIQDRLAMRHMVDDGRIENVADWR